MEALRQIFPPAAAFSEMDDGIDANHQVARLHKWPASLLQKWPSVWRVERMFMGKSEVGRRKYISSVLRRGRNGMPNLEVCF